MNRKIVAVIGISGVGKTTLLESFIQRHPSVVTVSASDLLKRKLSVNDSEELRTASSAAVKSNQDRLVQAFDDFKRSTPHAHILFDGHAIIDNDEGVVTIPTEIYKALTPDLIIFVEDDPNLIASRRDADSSRLRPSRSPQQLEDHQTLALNTSIEYGRNLSIPCEIVRSGDGDAFENVLDMYLRLER